MNLDVDNFEQEVLKSEIPVLVDFWATWCPPCSAMAPVMENLSTEFEGRVKVAKVNIDENQQLAAQYNISAIPAFLIFNKGEVVSTFVGIQTENKLQEALENV